MYANGERLETSPGGECKVCYCRGGEIQCAEVTCYIRNDCEGRTVPGQCCPKYDHCPPKGTKSQILPHPGTKISFVAEPAVKSFLEATQSSTSSEEVGNISWLTSFPTYNTTPKSVSYEPPPENNIQAKETEKELATPLQSDNEQPKITIQEIIPAIKEIPMTEPPKQKEEVKADDVELKLSDTVTEIKEDNDVVTFDVESDSSEISEIYHHPPPVLRIGDKLLFLKKGELVPEKDTSTPASVITIIGAEGLQRGFEDSAENLDSPENATKTAPAAPTEIATTTENLNVIPLQVITSTANSVEVQETQTEAVTTENNNLEAATTSQPLTSSTSEAALTTTEQYVTTEEIENKTESLENDTLVNTEENLTTEANMVEISPIPLDDIKEDPVLIEDENPAYPPIPEIMVPQVVEDLPEQDDEEPKETILIEPEQNVTDSKILPDVLEIRNNNTVPANVTHPEWLKNDSLSNDENLMNLRAALPQHILKERVDSDVEYSVTEEIASTTEALTTTEAAPATEATTIQTQKPVIILADDPKPSVSKETLEANEESGEVTTKKNSHASLMSNENASIDIVDNESPEEPAVEEDEKIVIKGVELKDGKVNENISPKMAAADVEMFDPTTIRRAYDVETIAPSPEKIVEKRENSMDSQIFQQLDQELKAGENGNGKTKEEDAKEAEEIFKELLEETNTTPKIKTTESQSAESRDKDTNALQRVSEALARFQLRDTKPSLDSSILGILRDFFTSQYRSYDGRN